MSDTEEWCLHPRGFFFLNGFPRYNCHESIYNALVAAAKEGDTSAIDALAEYAKIKLKK